VIYVCAGMYRSGSTWLYNAVRLILAHAGTPELAAGWITEKERLLRAANAVIKIHAFDAELVARPAIVLTSHRDLRDVAASLARKFGREFSLAPLRETVASHAQWARVAALDLRYEDLLADKKGPLERVAAALRLPDAALAALPFDAIAREVEGEKFEEGRATALRYDAVNLLHDGHVTDGRHGSWQTTLAPVAVAAIEREFRPWLAARGYLP
jgi:hypothetical protein